jgi:hypothetical protein
METAKIELIGLGPDRQALEPLLPAQMRAFRAHELFRAREGARIAANLGKHVQCIGER